MATIGEFISASRNNALCKYASIDKESGMWDTFKGMATKAFVDYAPDQVFDSTVDMLHPGINKDYYNEWNKQHGSNYSQQDYFNTQFGVDEKTGKPLFSYVNPTQKGSNVGAVDTLTNLNLFSSNPEYADAIIYNLQKMPKDQRERSPFIQSLRGLSNTFRKNNDSVAANKMDENVDSLISGVGVNGKNLLGTSQITRFIQSSVSDSLNKATQDSSRAGSDPAQKRLLNMARSRAEEQNKNKAFQEALGKYSETYLKPNLYDNPAGNALYGAFGSEGSAGALHNAAPWLSYGIPAAATASLFGNNKLWAPVLGGATLFGGLGYAKDRGWLGEFGNSGVMNAITDAHSFANKPIQNFINQALPGSNPITSKLFGSNSPQEKGNPTYSNPFSTSASKSTNPSGSSSGFSNGSGPSTIKAPPSGNTSGSGATESRSNSAL